MAGKINRAPTEKPSFTLSQIKKAIPPHCFNRSIWRSFSYLIRDFAFVSFFFYIALKLIPNLPVYVRLIAWPLYWVCQGYAFTGIWLIGHDCGHHSFSDYMILNDVVGFILHSLLLTPYYSWKITHRNHHSNNHSLENDETFVPRFKSTLQWYKKLKILKHPIGRFIYLTIALVLGFPMYFMFNLEGKWYPTIASHFDPYSPLFTKDERIKIAISDIGVAAMLYTTYYMATAYGGGISWIFYLYYAPMLVLSTCVDCFTLLQHTHSELPHYDSSEWDYLRGALGTVDRDYGAIFNLVLHNVTDAHVAHHIVSTIPHYHISEATKAIRPILGEYYRFDGTPIYKALWREISECIYVEADEKKPGVYWYEKLK